MNDWNEWFRVCEPTLRTGREAHCPKTLPHPREVGFTKPMFAEPWGQKADWVFSLPDGSRIHLHEFDSGRFIAHIDAVDPARGPMRAAFHWGTESASGRTALFATSLWLLLRALR